MTYLLYCIKKKGDSEMLAMKKDEPSHKLYKVTSFLYINNGIWWFPTDFFLFETVSCIQGWPWTWNVTKDDLELPIILFPTSQGLVQGCLTTPSFCVVLGIKHRALCKIGKPSTNWVTSSAFSTNCNQSLYDITYLKTKTKPNQKVSLIKWFIFKPQHGKW